MHCSSSLLCPALYVTPHPFRLHVAPSGTGVLRSSSSSSGGAGLGLALGVCAATATLAMAGCNMAFFSFCARIFASTSSSLGFVSGAGVSSTVLCLPVVHGGIVMNSSKVRTRGLQHFQPVDYQLE